MEDSAPPHPIVARAADVWTDHEMAMIEEGLADIAAGRVVRSERVDAWFAALEQGEQPPVRQSGQS